jgi:hypothetical protein
MSPSAASFTPLGTCLSIICSAVVLNFFLRLSSVLLVELVTIVVGLVVGLDVALAVLVQAIVGNLTVLKCDPILVLLGLKA